MDSRTLTVTIERAYAPVYAFLAEPLNFPRWASGLGSGLLRDGEHWWVDAPQGRMRVQFSAANAFGVLDHSVDAEGVKIEVPMRVVAAGNDSVVMLTILRQPDIDDAQFKADCDWVRKDLQALKKLLERRPRNAATTESASPAPAG